MLRGYCSKHVQAFVSAVVLAFCIHACSVCSAEAKADETYEKLKTFTDILSIIQKNYVEDVEPKEIIYNAIKGMVTDLDPHSTFLPPDIYKELKVETKGSFGGLGIEITIKDGILTVVSPIEDTPAYRAGIQTGDQIVKIEDESTKDMTLIDAVKLMRGKPDTKITITILRQGLSEPQEISITRAIIKIQSVKFNVLADDIGYIRIAQFQENTSADFVKAFNELKSEATELSGIILDLRGDPGGLLDEAVKISDMFLDEGMIVYTEGRIPSQKMQFFAKQSTTIIRKPVVVLVNGGSASASEIVAGALQDHGKAVIVGTQTFGKGTVQTIYPLGDGSGLRITTAKYYTPNHRSIQEKGITPDITVEDSIESSGLGRRAVTFIREKDLMNHFQGKREEPSELQKEPASEENSSKEREDPPLDTALHILKGLKFFKEQESTAVQ